MRGKRAFVMLVITTALGALGTASAVAKDDMNQRGDTRGGSVVPCDLSGVNPVHHPEIFGNPAVARQFGFVRSPDGAWHVQDSCLRGRRY
jgi:hypothetical protein